MNSAKFTFKKEFFKFYLCSSIWNRIKIGFSEYKKGSDAEGKSFKIKQIRSKSTMGYVAIPTVSAKLKIKSFISRKRQNQLILPFVHRKLERTKDIQDRKNRSLNFSKDDLCNLLPSLKAKNSPTRLNHLPLDHFTTFYRETLQIPTQLTNNG